MRGMYSAFIKNKDHFLIFFSVFISVTLLLSTEDPRMRFIRAKAADFTAFISSPFNWIDFLKDVEEQNRVLREKNLFLSLQVESMYNLKNENDELKKMLDFKNDTKFRVKSAKVINKGIQPNLASVLINIGAMDSVLKNQPVLTPYGVIGKVVELSSSNSIVQLISDNNFRISVRIMPSGATGILRWLNSGLAQIREVQKNVQINIGDKVITSGYSDIYPAGLPVGEVAGVYDDRSSYQKTINVTLPNDLSSFQNVFVIIGTENEN